MKKASANSPKKALIILAVIAIVAVILFGVVFGILYSLRQTKSMYSEFSAAISDPHSENYLEDENNFVAFPTNIKDFITTSSALEERLNFYLPYLLHIKFDKPTQKRANNLLKEFNDVKNYFSTVLNETKTDFLGNKDEYLYYGAFLPTYTKYINAKFTLVNFIEEQFNNVGFVFSSYFSNLNKLSNVYVKMAINIALPSIYITNNNQNKITGFINGNNEITLNYLNSKFLEFKNTFKNNVNTEDTNNFNTKFKELETTFNIALDLYNNLNNEKREQFLRAPKIMPSVVDPNSTSYEIDFLLSYFAQKDGKFTQDTTSTSIVKYFDF